MAKRSSRTGGTSMAARPARLRTCAPTGTRRDTSCAGHVLAAPAVHGEGAHAIQPGDCKAATLELYRISQAAMLPLEPHGHVAGAWLA